MAASFRKLDWVLVILYLVLVIFGWMNIYSSSSEEAGEVFTFSSKYGMHFIWMGISFACATAILFFISPKIYLPISWPLYVVMALLLVAVAFAGVEVNGSKSWFSLGPVRFQPAEFSKITTALAVATLLSKYDFSFSSKPRRIAAFSIILLPILFILLEKETGSALVYLGFLLPFYREGMSGWVLICGLLAIVLFVLTLMITPFTTAVILAGLITVSAALYSRRPLRTLIIGAVASTAIAFIPQLLKIEFIAGIVNAKPHLLIAIITIPVATIFLFIFLHKKNHVGRNAMLALICGIGFLLSVQFMFNDVLKEHQRARIETLLGITDDPMGVGYNVHQSMIAIGSGGVAGKGFLQGTQTHFNFVPEQSTDFIFCTIGEEWGFLGAIAVLVIYFTLIVKIIMSAEKQKDKFVRIYGYCTASCLLMHVFINISMTIGLMPVIGIPLPFLSYGGSSLLAFTILLFIYLRLDLEKWNH